MHRGQHCGNITLPHQLAISTLCDLSFEMASAMSSLQSNECPICLDLLKDPRVLKCQHTFCRNCLETRESNKTIRCPQCRVVTDIFNGKFRCGMYTETNMEEDKREPLQLIKKIKISSAISSVRIDEYVNPPVVYIGTADETNPVLKYSLRGKLLGHLPAAGIGPNPDLAIDTNNGFILVAAAYSVLLYDREGRQTGTIKCPEFGLLTDIAYQAHNDRYVVGDIDVHRLHFITNNKIVHSVPAEEVYGIQNFYIATSRSADNTTLATLCREQGLLKMYHDDGRSFKSYGGEGHGYGQLNRPCGVGVDRQGRVIVSDTDNNRMVRVSPGEKEQYEEWKAIHYTERYYLGAPRMIDITYNGMAAVAFVDDSQEDTYHLAILSGLD